MFNPQEEKRRIIIKYIRNNPNATYRIIQRDTKLHLRRYFSNIEEAFNKAGVKLTRNTKTRTPEEKRRIIIKYIRNNPNAGGQRIRKDTKINFFTIFKSIEEAFKEAGVEYPRKEQQKIRKISKQDKITTIEEFIKNNPGATYDEIKKETGLDVYKVFANLKEAYQMFGLKEMKYYRKRRIGKQKIIINFIRINPLATQREINKACGTKVQELFEGGIFEAYKQANIPFPFERLKMHGTTIKSIRKRAEDFEKDIAIKLSGYGHVNRLVKTKRGIADIIFERKGRKAIIEVKDYEAKEISISQVKQLNKYLEDCNCELGFLICKSKPKKDRFLIGKNRIFILEDSEISKLPELIPGL